ncbi:MAG TPA: c-type cytochrome, partial [Bryobacteraceae bacterium]|nr:c-type cytochrome [Bryobacteraceae bacterium]
MRHLTYILPIAWLFTIPVYAQQPPEAPRPPQRQPPAPKNLKLLKPEEIRTTMQAFRVALGVPCTGCHVQGDFASDANRHKEIARKMIVMTRDINAQFGDAKTHVTCYTCHRGAEDPLTAPPAATAGAATQPGAPRSAGASATPAGTTL